MGLPEKIFDKMCEETEKLTLDEALRKAMIYEIKIAAKSGDDNNNNVNYVNNNGKFGGNNGKGNKNKNFNKKRGKCSHCGWRNHVSEDCRFKSSKCNHCGKIGHLAAVCRSKNRSHVNYVSKMIKNNDNIKLDPLEVNDIFNSHVFSITDDKSNVVYSLTINIDGVEVTAACDTGAPCILVSKFFLAKYGFNKKLRKCSFPYMNYSGDYIKIFGEYDALITYSGVTKKLNVVVADGNNPILLGRTFLRSFDFELTQVNFISGNYDIIVNGLKSEFSQVFSDCLGKYKISEVTLALNENAVPVFFKPRPLPFAYKEKGRN